MLKGIDRIKAINMLAEWSLFNEEMTKRPNLVRDFGFNELIAERVSHASKIALATTLKAMGKTQ